MERFKWPVPSDEYFRHHLIDGETSTVQYRVERYRFLWEEFGPPMGMLLVGGFPSMFALDELKRSYAYGNFMATVLLAQAFIEQSLGGTYSLAGEDQIAHSGFARLVDAARNDGHITGALAETLNKLRKMRNPYTHHTGGVGNGSYMRRVTEPEFVAPEDLVVEDAKFAIRAVVDYLRNGSPDWNPQTHQWSEGTDDR